MPTIEIDLNDLEKLIGKKLPTAQEELEELFMFVKGEIDKKENNKVWLDIKETNRPDLWSSEGIARELKAKLGIEKGLPKYQIKKSNIELFIEKSVEQSRPFIAAAIARNIKFSDEFLKQMIQLQEKVAHTFGRKRKEAAIGLYDFDKMTPPIYYRGYKNEQIEFIPLGWKVKMKPKEILQEHEKGKEFKTLLEGVEKFPIVIDSKQVVASMPPIINSEATGKITEKTKNVFVEVTGFKWEVVQTALNVMVMALADRGAEIEAVKIHFPHSKVYPKKTVLTPEFKTSKMLLNFDMVKKIAGFTLSNEKIIQLLKRSRFDIKMKKRNKAEVIFPSYRQDIIHAIDLVEDILISYGYNKIEPLKIELAVIGDELPKSKKLRLVREVCLGMSLQEILQFTLTSREIQEKKMNLSEQEFVEIANPVTLSRSIFRKSIIPETLEFFAKNKSATYPQKIFEVGKTFELDEKAENKVSEKNKLCVALTKSALDFTEIKSYLEAYSKTVGYKYSLRSLKHPSFIEGRAAEILEEGNRKGIIGEIHPSVLQNFGLVNPVALFEIEV